MGCMLQLKRKEVMFSDIQERSTDEETNLTPVEM